ncbi:MULTISPECIES: hypothetical protein [Clostridium]|uniref:Tgh044-related protein n=1 Tax=Clostridium novyi (strain NT) TaxID=386415 RepID=A0Q1W4_CLONN|nr:MULTISPECIES: hypothetical protein [Clostridium]ABK61474.1 Tgh044-related protein [Clostridium novyi NT]
MLKSIKEYDEIARGDVTIFLEEFEKIKQYYILKYDVDKYEENGVRI